MGDRERIGIQAAEQIEETFFHENNISNFEIVDVSFGQKERGFDITGHHYWHRNPWASSDIIILLRTDLLAEQRGLSLSQEEVFWYLADKYPEKAQNALSQTLSRE